jgi:tRNA (cytidine/uridine-2'-O-)-methyltransferase
MQLVYGLYFSSGSKERFMIADIPFNIVLVEPEIPPNTGNIARLCAATGSILHLVGRLGFSIDDKHLKRAGLDYWQHVAVHRWDTLGELQSSASQGRFFYLSTKVARSYLAVAFQPGDFLVFGRETRGLPEELLNANPDTCITIPMPAGAVRSLNLSTSAGIVLYEALRQSGRIV